MLTTLQWVLVGVAVVVVLAIIIWIIAGYNALIRLRNNNEEAFSTMDVFMKKRYDLVPNLVNTVKGYAKHESETLENVIHARNLANGATSTEEKLKAEKDFSSALSRLLVVAENYPELKANTNFLDLQTQLKTLEIEIANSRKYYNGNVKIYNNKVQMFPSNIIAKMFRFKKATMFEITNQEERNAVKVEF